MKRMIDYKEFLELQDLANKNNQRLDYIEGAYTYFHIGLDDTNFEHLLPSAPEDFQPQTLEIGDTIYIEGVSATLDADMIKEIFDSNLFILDCGAAPTNYPTVFLQRQFVDEESASVSPRNARFEAFVNYGGALYEYTMNVVEYDETSEEGGFISISCASTLSISEITSAGSQITALKPVVELMTGYSFVVNTSLSNVSLDVIYAGVCKNGNKLTLTIFGKLTNNGASDVYLASFPAPSSILSKLYPYVVQGANVLAQKEVEFFPSENFSALPLKAVFETTKSNTAIIINARKLSELTTGVEYFFRFEQTFLLSENLAE